MKAMNIALSILTILVVEQSFAATTRYKGTNLPPNSAVYPENVKECFVSIDETSSSYSVRTSQSSELFVFKKQEIKHPINDPDYADLDVNFTDADYEVYSAKGKDGYMRLDLKKANDRLSPRDYVLFPNDGNTTRIKHCFFTNILN